MYNLTPGIVNPGTCIYARHLIYTSSPHVKNNIILLGNISSLMMSNPKKTNFKGYLYGRGRILHVQN